MLSFYNPSYSFLAVYTDTEPDITAKLSLSGAEGCVCIRCRRMACTVFPIAENMEYTLSVENGTVALAYLFSEEASRPVSFITEGGEAENKYHFTPMHLPVQTVGAVFFFGGVYHLFYNAVPFSQGADLYYLCHAQSVDLVSWAHLPILAAPSEELCITRHHFGGVWGGSVEEKDGVARLYFTRRIKDRKTKETLFAYQVRTESRDLAHLSPEKTVIRTGPVPESDMGTPFVFTENGLHYLLVGGTLFGKAASFLYRETAEGAWEYAAPLFKNNLGNRMDFLSFYRDGRCFVALYSLEGFTDSDGVRNPAYWLCGTFQEEKFFVRTRGRVDFGGDFYSPRICNSENRTLLFGSTATCGNGCMSVPRALFRKKGQLCQKPAKEVYALLGKTLYEGKGEDVTLSVPSAYYAVLSFHTASPFRLLLSENEQEKVYFYGDEKSCGYIVENETGEKRFYTVEMPLEKLEIFADGTVLESFVNGGMAAGTRKIPCAVPIFKAEFADGDKVESLAVREICAPQNPF